MKKKLLIALGCILAVIVLLIVIILAFFAYKARVSTGAGGTSVAVIGGADGPTSVFLAGKLGDGKSNVVSWDDPEFSGEKPDQNLGRGEIEMKRQEVPRVVEFSSIDMEQAKEVFREAGDYIILDVRRPDEYAEGHIPGAVNVANEIIGEGEIAELPDKDQVIYVYCRSGRRSKEASAKLAALGYTNIIECGGILDWTGSIEK